MTVEGSATAQVPSFLQPVLCVKYTPLGALMKTALSAATEFNQALFLSKLEIISPVKFLGCLTRPTDVLWMLGYAAGAPEDQ